jgi:ketosteroid isomerase-like protein
VTLFMAITNGLTVPFRVTMDRGSTGTDLPDAAELSFQGGTMLKSGRVLILTFLLMNLAGATRIAWAGPPVSKAESGIRALLEQQSAAWNRGDIAGFMAGYWNSPETTFAGASGVQRGWQAVLDRYQREYPNREIMGTLTFSGLEIHMLSNDAAFVLGRWHLERAKDSRGPAGGMFTLILRRFPQGWRIVHDHTSADTPVAAPHS